MLLAVLALGATAATAPSLKEPVFERLSVGSIQPTGWLERQLGFAASGCEQRACAPITFHARTAAALSRD